MRLSSGPRDAAGLMAALVIPILTAILSVIREAYRIYGEIALIVVVVMIWPSIRYFGNLGRIMRVAAKSDNRTRMLIEDMKEGMQQEHAYNTILSIYEPLVSQTNEVLRVLGSPTTLDFVSLPTSSPHLGPRKYAAVALKTRGYADLATILGQLRRDIPVLNDLRNFAEERQHLMQQWRKMNFDKRNDTSGSNYCLAEMRIESHEEKLQLRLDVGVVQYGQIARTCESLVNEFALFAFLRRCKHAENHDVNACQGRMSASTALRCMPWRKRIHALAKSPFDLFFRPSARAAGLGVGVVTWTANESDERSLFLARRTDLVGTYPNVLHLIPAGNCNTHNTEIAIVHGKASSVPDWYLEAVMRSEYLEEWYERHELEDGKEGEWHTAIERLWNEERVDQVRPLQLNGIAVDLLNIRPELCADIQVMLDDVRLGKTRLNWESEGDAVRWKVDDVGDFEPHEMVQAAAGAIYLFLAD